MLNKIRHHIRRFFYHRRRFMLPAMTGGYASRGQDVYVAGLLQGKKDGVFVDIGAADGVSMNNTLYFERALGWSGLAVEPVPSAFERLKNERACRVINGCVSARAGREEFVELVGQTMFSTLGKYNTGLTARRLSKRARRFKTEMRVSEVECFTLPDLLRESAISSIDFLKIDTEGGELDILKTLDFAEFSVSVISVENNWFSDDIRAYLEKHDFIYMGTFSVDEIYIHKSLRTAAGGETRT